MTKVDNISCSACGYEDFDVEVVFVRHVANGAVYECPGCKKETMDVDIDDQFLA